jgi:hypothetical protein
MACGEVENRGWIQVVEGEMTAGALPSRNPSDLGHMQEFDCSHRDIPSRFCPHSLNRSGGRRVE